MPSADDAITARPRRVNCLHACASSAPRIDDGPAGGSAVAAPVPGPRRRLAPHGVAFENATAPTLRPLQGECANPWLILRGRGSGLRGSVGVGLGGRGDSLNGSLPSPLWERSYRVVVPETTAFITGGISYCMANIHHVWQHGVSMTMGWSHKNS